MKKTFYFAMFASILFAMSCGGGAKEVKLSEKGKMLTAKTWKYDTNGSIKGVTDAVKDTSGITADIELKGDVGKIADFLTGTLRFQVDKKGKLAYERKYGSGFLSTSTLGYWNFNEDESGLTMRDWDKAAGKEKPGVNYTIVELTADKLVIKEESGATSIYKAQ